MSFGELMLLYRCINTGPASSFMGNIVGVFLVTDHWQWCDGLQLCGDPEELISRVAVNRHLGRREGLRGGKDAEEDWEGLYHCVNGYINMQ